MTLSKSIRIGRILRKAVEPVEAVLKETGGRRLFEGIVQNVERATEAGFTFIKVKLAGVGGFTGDSFELVAKCEILAAYGNKKLAAIAPDIITPVRPEKGTCVTAEEIEKDDRLTILGLPSPDRWRERKGLDLWREVMKEAGIAEEYRSLDSLDPRH